MIETCDIGMVGILYTDALSFTLPWHQESSKAFSQDTKLSDLSFLSSK
jgi:hypothetical protein